MRSDGGQIWKKYHENNVVSEERAKQQIGPQTRGVQWSSVKRNALSQIIYDLSEMSVQH